MFPGKQIRRGFAPRRALQLVTVTALSAAVLLLGLSAPLQAAPDDLAPPDGVARAVAQQAGLEGRVLWVDGTANLERLSTRQGVAALMDHCVRAHINTIVMDIKPLSGHVLYDSKLAPHLREWKGFRYPAGYDLLKVALDEGHKRGLQISANINVFSDGHKLVHAGPIYEKPDQQSIIYDTERVITTPKGERHRMSIGVNRGPDDDEIAVYDAGYRMPRTVSAGEAFALVLSDRVEAVVDGSLAPAKGVFIPADGYMLVGKGAGAKWILQNLHVGDTPTWSANDKLIPVVDAPSETVAAFMNPVNPVSRDYELKIVDELVSNYDLDGVVFDRMRYASLHSDFSELSREKFEEFLGQRLNRFPADIYSFDPTPGHPIIWGPYFKQWLEWRARNIRTWLESANRVIRTKRPHAKIGVYVGSWFATYYTVGVNWGSDDAVPAYDWMTPTYSSTGYAGLLDWVSTGCYHPIATREQAQNAGLDDNYTVEAAAQLSSRVVGDESFTYAGVYVKDYDGSPAAFLEAIQAAREHSEGVMLFDLSYIEDYRWWPIIEEAFSQPKKAPHDVPKLLQAVRTMRKALNVSNRALIAAPAPQQPPPGAIPTTGPGDAGASRRSGAAASQSPSTVNQK